MRSELVVAILLSQPERNQSAGQPGQVASIHLALPGQFHEGSLHFRVELLPEGFDDVTSFCEDETRRLHNIRWGQASSGLSQMQQMVTQGGRQQGQPTRPVPEFSVSTRGESADSFNQRLDELLEFIAGQSLKLDH